MAKYHHRMCFSILATPKLGLAQSAGLAVASSPGPPNQMLAAVFLHSHGAAGSARRQSSALHRFASSHQRAMEPPVPLNGRAGL